MKRLSLYYRNWRCFTRATFFTKKLPTQIISYKWIYFGRTIPKNLKFNVSDSLEIQFEFIYIYNVNLPGRWSLPVRPKARVGFPDSIQHISDSELSPLWDKSKYFGLVLTFEFQLYTWNFEEEIHCISAIKISTWSKSFLFICFSKRGKRETLKATWQWAIIWVFCKGNFYFIKYENEIRIRNRIFLSAPRGILLYNL